MIKPTLNITQCGALIEQGLSEDIGSGDITTELLVPEAAQARLGFRTRQDITVAGIELIHAVYSRLTTQIELTLHCDDTDKLQAGDLLATVFGPARALLIGERLALNLLQRACGVATLTRRYVDMVAGTGVQIRDTRKTMPGLRMLDKYAVTCGGGVNHRLRLDDMILIKDNHIALCGSITQAVTRAKAGNSAHLPVEVECDTLEQVTEALDCDVNWILLDNMPPDLLVRAVQMRQQKAPSIKLEASGGVTLQTLRLIAETGVDAISVGALTHSAPAVDIGLDVEIQPV